jgi:hypothetical protein
MVVVQQSRQIAPASTGIKPNIRCAPAGTVDGMTMSQLIRDTRHFHVWGWDRMLKGGALSPAILHRFAQVDIPTAHALRVTLMRRSASVFSL